MADRAVTAAMSDVNTTVHSTANSMAYLQDEVTLANDSCIPYMFLIVRLLLLSVFITLTTPAQFT